MQDQLEDIIFCQRELIQIRAENKGIKLIN